MKHITDEGKIHPESPLNSMLPPLQYGWFWALETSDGMYEVFLKHPGGTRVRWNDGPLSVHISTDRTYPGFEEEIPWGYIASLRDLPCRRFLVAEDGRKARLVVGGNGHYNIIDIPEAF